MKEIKAENQDKYSEIEIQHANHSILSLLENSKMNTENIIDNQPDVFAIITDTGRILKGNKMLAKILHCNLDECLDKNIVSIFSTDLQSHFIDQIQKSQKHKNFTDIQLAIKNSELGEDKIFLWSINSSFKKHPYFGIISHVFGRDITELHKYIMKEKEHVANLETVVAEKTSELREKIEKLKESQGKLIHSAKFVALGEMAGGAAHEINNPLTIIAGNVYQLQKMLKSGEMNTKVLEKSLETIDKTTKRIAKIIVGLLEFSSNKENEKPKTASIKSIIEQAVIFCDEKFKHHNIQFSLNIIEDVKIKCMPSQISQTILNLLNNSFDAIKDRNEKWIIIHVQKSQAWLEITVTDSGNEISDNIKNKIMQPFFSTKDIGMGTGLNLSISYGVIKAHGGQLILNATTPNTQFLIRLPL